MHLSHIPLPSTLRQRRRIRLFTLLGSGIVLLAILIGGIFHVTGPISTTQAFADDYYNNRSQSAYARICPAQQTPAIKAIFAQLKAPSFISYDANTSDVHYRLTDESLTQAHVQMSGSINLTFPSNPLVPHDVLMIPTVTLTLRLNGIEWCVALDDPSMLNPRSS